MENSLVSFGVNGELRKSGVVAILSSVGGKQLSKQNDEFQFAGRSFSLRTK
jgi:hypothetical protein